VFVKHSLKYAHNIIQFREHFQALDISFRMSI